MSINVSQVIKVMIECVNDILFPYYYQCETSKKYPHTLNVSEGHGKKTYHQKQYGNKHVIVFGKKMVLSKMESEESASHWLTYSEIKNFHFYDGITNMKTLMAATVIHEFGHYLQTIRGHRLYRSVHNKEFYKILKELHELLGERVLEYIENDIRTENLDYIDKTPFTPLDYPKKPIFSRNDLFVGAKITFINTKEPDLELYCITIGRTKIYCTDITGERYFSIKIKFINSIKQVEDDEIPFIPVNIGNVVSFNFHDKVCEGTVKSIKECGVIIENKHSQYSLPLTDIISIVNKKEELKFSPSNIRRGDIILFEDKDGTKIKLPIKKVNRLNVICEKYENSNLITYKIPYFLIIKKES